MKSSIALLIADDHEMIRVSLRQALSALTQGAEIVEAWDGDSTLAALHAAVTAGRPCDLALIDFMMPGVNGVDWFRALRQAYPTLRIVVMSGLEAPEMVQDLGTLGIAGFIPKSDSAARMLLAIRIVIDGGTYAPLRFMAGGAARALPEPTQLRPIAGLTERQTRVLELLAKGMATKVIARQLGLSDSTVKVHLVAIYRAFGVKNRTEAALAAARYFDATP